MSNKHWDKISYAQSQKSISGVDGRTTGEIITELKDTLEVFIKPTKPEVFGEATKWYACPHCMRFLDINDAHCRHCGAKIDWSEQ